MLNQTEAKLSRIILTAEKWQMPSNIYRRSVIQTMHDSMSTLHDFEVENPRRAFRFELVARDTGFITEKPCRAPESNQQPSESKLNALAARAIATRWGSTCIVYESERLVVGIAQLDRTESSQRLSGVVTAP